VTDLSTQLADDPADEIGSSSAAARPLKDVSLPPEERDGWDGITKPKQRSGGPRFLTDVIVELGLCEAERVEQAIATARNSGTTPEQELLSAGAISHDNLARALAERHGLEHIDLTAFQIDMAAAGLISVAAARRYDAVPVAYRGERALLVAMADPANVVAMDDIAIMTGLEIRPAVASREDLQALVARLGRMEDVVPDLVDGPEHEFAQAEIVDLRESVDDAPIIKLANQIIAQAVEQGASDIHLEPEAEGMRVRLRVDGVLMESTVVPRSMVAGVISRIKVMAELDIAERRVPQDGRVGLSIDGHHVDLRVVTLPSVHGESVVMRILDKESVVMDLDRLGMGEDDRERFERAIHEPYGAVLVTGPTGSGKSTTLYAALGVINTPEKNVITIEDPVEYQLEGVTQVQVNPRAGLHFATGLRSMMRADPDVIMVGEIRDRETAQIAVEAALTGHLLLSTLHTNDAATAITRLVEMGVEPFLVASSVGCVVAQRLARTLCQHCKQRAIIPVATLRANGFPSWLDVEAYEPVGCGRCNNSGYKGRLGLYEVMIVTEEIRSLAVERASADKITEVAVKDGMTRLREDGLRKVMMGRTSLAEVARVTGTSS
jgi:type IV pilus assembly protein PilB